MNKTKNKLFPIYFKGKKYLEKDCNDVFLGFYTSKEALNEENGVYLAEDMWVYPDGSMERY
jgi:hypothetical protein|tara:strand:+ start:1980 stop:2162 length:183 start_codon:yes stop_codon:yes gene_type:complete